MEISEIKQRLSLSEVIKHYGLKADKQNRLHCPFHEDKTPSLQLYYKTQTAYCFSGNCKTHGRSMDVIDFIMYKEDIGKHEAIIKAQSLMSNAQSQTPNASSPTLSDATASSSALSLEPSALGIKPSALSLEPSAFGGMKERSAFLGRMFTYFKNAVHNSQPARQYLQSRCLKWNEGGIEVGYNGGQFHHGARKEEMLIHQCLQYGLLIDKDLTGRTGEKAYGIFGNRCIVFALRNLQDEIVSLYFRSTLAPSPSERAGGEAARHFYLKDRQGLYPGYPKQETKKLIITESIIDAATLLEQKEIKNSYEILSLFGTNGLTQEHLAAIREWAAPSPLRKVREGLEIILWLNADKPGEEAVKKHAATLRQLYPQLQVTCVQMPAGEDINSMAQSHDDTTIFVDLLDTRSNDFSFSVEKNKGKKTVLETGLQTAQPPAAAASSLEPSALSLPPLLERLNACKLRYESDTAVYYVQGSLPKTTDNLKIMLVVESKASGYKARNKTDLYEDRQTEKLCSDVSEKLNLRKDLLETDIYRLTGLLEQHIEAQIQTSQAPLLEEPGRPLTAKERAELEGFAKKPRLIRRLNDLLGASGVTGEERNRIFLLIIAVSHKMPETLHALIQGSSGSGKTKLLRQISDCMPPDKVTRFTRISDKALYHYPENYFTNRLLVIEDADGLSEEAELAFRELQSGGELRSSLSIKLDNGQHTGGEKIVKGPVASLSCTTRGELYEDNMSRVFLIAIDESAEQTKRIIQYQNAVAAGVINREEEEKTKRFIQKLVGILEPYRVINPYAAQILLPEEAHKIRRLNDLFQSFVKMVTVINQYQRKRDEKKRLITEIEDMETAVHILFESIVLKVDELDGSLRQFFERLKIYLQKQNKDKYRTAEFTLREIRQALKLSKTQVFRYAGDLCELEYIRQSGGYQNKGYSYRITWWDNYQSLREKIKQSMEEQLKALKSGTLRNATGTLQPA
jgi:DNA primase/energy-coupling factor transporter ATP-binding protein EcfA2